MKIMIISYFFPPYAIIGAVRVGKMAKYLTAFGHDVRVISAADQPLPTSLPVEIPLGQVVYTKWYNVNSPVEMALGGRERVVSSAELVPQGTFWSAVKKGLWNPYKTILNFPDPQVGWFPFARSAGADMIKSWQPDVIYASAVPYTSLLIAASLSKKYSIPWVAELRDLWIDNHYYSFPNWRRSIEAIVEKKILSSANGMVTVSEPLAQVLRSKFNKPVQVVMNGFDPEDSEMIPVMEKPKNELSIVYTGLIYEGKRDPSPLFEALSILGLEADIVKVKFYGRSLGIVRQMAKRYGVERSVEINDPVPYQESLRIQKEADILLLLLWDDPQERGVFTGKLFEYLGAKRPVLTIGPADNVASELIISRNAGYVSNQAQSIAAKLKDWIELKKRDGVIAQLNDQVTKGLTREDQARVMEEFFTKVTR
ncbi:MAG: glycosyltransferase [Candidatus Saccharibacteria bacterium]